MEKNISLQLSIPKKATSMGKKFLVFCVKKFGGKSKLFNVPELDRITLHSLATEFLGEANEIKRRKNKIIETNYSCLIHETDLAESYENGVIKLHFIFLSEKPLNSEMDSMLGDHFLKKVRQLFDELNHGERVHYRLTKSYEAYLRAKRDSIDAQLNPKGIGYEHLFL